MLIPLPQALDVSIFENLAVGGCTEDLGKDEIGQDQGAEYGYALSGRILPLDQGRIWG
jgi:hypothetical protein